MKNSYIIIVVAVLLIAGAFGLVWMNNSGVLDISFLDDRQASNIEGCYVAENDKDTYILKIESVEAGNVSGTLSFENFEKDSSSGTFTGTYRNDVLLGDYEFDSEGTHSVMQVIFNKKGEDFVRGFGDMSADGTQFADLEKITYDNHPLSLFKKGECS